MAKIYNVGRIYKRGLQATTGGETPAIAWLSPFFNYDEMAEWNVSNKSNNRTAMILDVREIMAQNPGWFIETVQVTCSLKRSINSNNHRWAMSAMLMDEGVFNPSTKPAKDLLDLASNTISVYPNYNWQDHIVRVTMDREITSDTYAKRFIVLSSWGEVGAERYIGTCFMTGLSMYRYTKGFPGWGSEVLKDQIGKPNGWLSEVAKGWMSEFVPRKEDWKPALIVPLMNYSAEHFGGRGSGVPGDLWGGGRVRMTYQYGHPKTIIAMRFQMKIRKYQGSSQGSNGIFITNTEHHETPAYGTGVTYTKWIACNYGPDEDIVFELRGNGSQGEGKSIDHVWVAAVRYADGTEEKMIGMPENPGYA